MDVDDFVAHLADMLAAARQEARDEAVAPVLALAEEWERSPWDWLRTTAAPALRAAVEDSGALARIQAEAWPCANYTAPVTCLHAGTTTPCDWCREAGAGAEQRGAAQVKAAVESLIDQWSVGDNGQDYRRAVTQCAQAIRTAFADADMTAHDRAAAAEFDRQRGYDHLSREERSKRAYELSAGAPVIDRRDRAVAAETARSASESVLSVSRMLDSTYPPDLDREAHRWRRCAKVYEEAGEVTEALLGLVGENPRKGVTASVDDLRRELLDVALAALGAVAHIDGNQGDPLALLTAHANAVETRLAAAVRQGGERE